MTPPADRARRLALAAILLGALAMRIWTLGYALPFASDEQEGHNMRAALRMAAARDFDPGIQALYGKGFIYYPLLAAYGGWYLVERVAGGVEGPEDFALDVLRDATPLLLLGRLLQAAASTAGVAAMYLWARALGGPGVGLAAAALLAVNPHHLNNSHFPTVENWALLFGTAGLALGAAGRGGLGAAAIGLGGGAKFLDAVSFFHPAASALRRPRRLALLVAAFAAGFLATNPFLLLRAGSHLPRLTDIFVREYGGAGGEGFSAAAYVARFLHVSTLGLVEAVGVTGAALYLVGLFGRAAPLPRSAWAIPLAFAAFLSLFLQHGAEYWMAVFPFLLPTAALGLETLRRRLPRWAATLAVAAALLEPAARAVPLEMRWSFRPPELAVRDWVHAHVPSGARVAVLHSHLAYKIVDSAEAAAAKAAAERARGGRRAEYFEALVRLHDRRPGLAAYDLRWIVLPYWRPGQYNREIRDFAEGMGGWTVEETRADTFAAAGVEWVVMQALDEGRVWQAPLVARLRADVEAAGGRRVARIPALDNVPVDVYRIERAAAPDTSASAAPRGGRSP